MAKDEKKRTPARREKECIAQHPWGLLKEEATKEIAEQAAWETKSFADAVARGEIQVSYQFPSLSPEEVEARKQKAAELEKARKAIDRANAIRDGLIPSSWEQKQARIQQDQLDTLQAKLTDLITAVQGKADPSSMQAIAAEVQSIATETKSALVVQIEATRKFLKDQHALMKEAGRGYPERDNKEEIGRDLHELLKTAAARSNSNLRLWSARSIVLRMNENNLW
jgi:hypothetical protein